MVWKGTKKEIKMPRVCDDGRKNLCRLPHGYLFRPKPQHGLLELGGRIPICAEQGSTIIYASEEGRMHRRLNMRIRERIERKT